MVKNDFFTIFIFPFKFERGDSGEIKPEKFIKEGLTLHENSSQGWKREVYTLNTADNYNEYYYFHYFVREAIFNKHGNTGMEYLVRTDYKSMKVDYIIGDDKNLEEKSMVTDIKSIDLHLFDNQIGLLTITTEKVTGDNETTFNDFIRYNDIARRVYPPYLTADEDNTKHLKSGSKLLPNKITIYKENEENGESISEDFPPLTLKEDNHDVLYLSKIIRELLSPLELTKIKNRQKDKFYFTPFADDRMFIISYFADSELSNELTKRHDNTDNYPYEIPNTKPSDDWYRFIFVDGNFKNIQNPVMQRELISKHTYSRWADYGTLYGFSRYSLVMLCSMNAPSHLKQYMKSMYYQMALIVLFQRAMLLKFSDDMADFLKLLQKESLPKQRDRTNKLCGDFIKFINKYWFLEITPQEQGIEMYSQWLGLINLNKLYEKITQEITSLSNYLENKIVFETSRKLAIITVIGFPFVAISLLFSFWGLYLTKIDRFTSIGELLASLPFSSKLLLMVALVMFIIFFIFVLLIFKTIIGRKFIDSLT
ncbi:MAG: hypothetical protein DDT22_00604 [candidate division WS2 bacterium]|nr:hypothetical protein [Candidatus Lithacetigena glycinireducens]